MIIRHTLPPNPPKEFRTALQAILVGRRSAPEQRIDLDLAPDVTVSHRHARLSYEDGAYWVEDLGSTNGTHIDGKRITGKVKLALTSKLEIGQTLVEILAETSPVPPPPLQHEPMPDGAIDEVAGAGAPLFDAEKSAEEDKASHAWQQLKIFYNLSQALGKAANLDDLLHVLTEQLQEAVPSAQRGAILLPDERGELLLKAHWPLGDQSVSMTLVKKAYDQREAFIWRAPTQDMPARDKPASVIYYRVKAAIYVPLLFGEQVLGVMYMDNYETAEAFSPRDLDLLRAIGNQVAMYIKEHSLRQDQNREELFRANLLRQFSPQIADRMAEQYSRLQLGGERVNPVTILMSDVRGFTTISAAMKPDDVVRMLNEMFDAFVPIIFEYDGVIDKYVGDAVLAIFGSPEPDEDQWRKAVKAALEMQSAIEKLGQGWKVRRLPVYEVGIGINTGEVIHGFIGSSARMEYTVIGDTVNRTARLCDGAAAGEVVISQAVYERVYRCLEVEPKTIRTKHPEREPDLKAYVVTGMKDAPNG